MVMRASYFRTSSAHSEIIERKLWSQMVGDAARCDRKQSVKLAASQRSAIKDRLLQQQSSRRDQMRLSLLRMRRGDVHETDFAAMFVLECLGSEGDLDLSSQEAVDFLLSIQDEIAYEEQLQARQYEGNVNAEVSEAGEELDWEAYYLHLTGHGEGRSDGSRLCR